MCSPTGTGTLAGLTELVLSRSDVPLAGCIGVVLQIDRGQLAQARARLHVGHGSGAASSGSAACAPLGGAALTGEQTAGPSSLGGAHGACLRLSLSLQSLTKFWLRLCRSEGNGAGGGTTRERALSRPVHVGGAPLNGLLSPHGAQFVFS